MKNVRLQMCHTSEVTFVVRYAPTESNRRHARGDATAKDALWKAADAAIGEAPSRDYVVL